MNRYQFPIRVDTTKGVRYNLSAIPTTVPAEEVPFFYISKFGDRLDYISSAFYKTPKYWWLIARANNLTNGSIAVQPGTRLFIPNIII
jgi:nucleoid-associated protein YgaU